MNMRGDYKTYEGAAVTTAATTTKKLDKRGFGAGCVTNESGGSITITWYGSIRDDDTPLAVEYPGATAITTVVGDDKCVSLPPALAGIPYVYPVGSGAASLTFHFESLS